MIVGRCNHFPVDTIFWTCWGQYGTTKGSVISLLIYKVHLDLAFVSDRASDWCTVNQFLKALNYTSISFELTPSFRTRRLVPRSPSTKEIASIRLDFPEYLSIKQLDCWVSIPDPLGPTIAVKRRRGPMICRPLNDLKSTISNDSM